MKSEKFHALFRSLILNETRMGLITMELCIRAGMGDRIAYVLERSLKGFEK
jgi:hypothetical protein